MKRILKEYLWVRSVMVVAIITLCALAAVGCTKNSSPTAPEANAGGSVVTWMAG